MIFLFIQELTVPSHSFVLQAIQLTKFDYRLANKLDTDLQKHDRVNYHALKFTDPIRDIGKMLVERMRLKTKHFIALHLRFEPDMLALSGCYYGGGDKERTFLGALRKRWKSLHASNPDKVRTEAWKMPTHSRGSWAYAESAGIWK